MPANVYMSLYGSDSANGLSPSTPVRSFAKACSLLVNRSPTQQTVWIMGGPSRAAAYQYGTLNGQPEYWRNNSKHGTATGWIVFRNFPGTYVRMKPLIQNVNTGYQDAVGTTNVGYNAFIWEVDNDDTANPDAHHFELDGGCTGLLSNGVTFNGSNYTPTAGVFMLGVSGVKLLDNNLTIDANGDVVTSIKGAYWSGGWIHHTKKALAVISNIEGPTCIRGILGTHGAMENVYMWSGTYGSNGTAAGVWPHTVMINSTVHFKSPDRKSLPGPAVIEDCVTQDTWGETIGPYTVNGCVIRRNKVYNACLGSLYNDIGEGFAMTHNEVYQTPDATYARRGWGANASSETAQKYLRFGIIHSNVIHGPGVVLGWVKQGANDYVRDILCAHNTVITTSAGQQALSSWGAAVDPSVRVQNNVFATTLTSAIAAFGSNALFGTHKGNRWSKAPPNAGFLAGEDNAVLSLAAMRLAQSTPVTKAGMGPAWFTPLYDSPLLGAGVDLPTPPCWVDESQTLFGRPFPRVVIGPPPAASVWTDIDGGTIPAASPTIGAVQRADVSPQMLRWYVASPIVYPRARGLSLSIPDALALALARTGVNTGARAHQVVAKTVAACAVAAAGSVPAARPMVAAITQIRLFWPVAGAPAAGVGGYRYSVRLSEPDLTRFLVASPGVVPGARDGLVFAGLTDAPEPAYVYLARRLPTRVRYRQVVGEVADYGIDWSALLDAGDMIAQSAWTTETGGLVGFGIQGTLTWARLAGVAERYIGRLTNTITVSDGRRLVRAVEIEGVDG